MLGHSLNSVPCHNSLIYKMLDEGEVDIDLTEGMSREISKAIENAASSFRRFPKENTFKFSIRVCGNGKAVDLVSGGVGDGFSLPLPMYSKGSMNKKYFIFKLNRSDIAA